MSGITVLMKETPESSLTLALSGIVYEPGSRHSPNMESASSLILDIPASRTIRSKCLLLSHPIYSIEQFLMQPKQTKTIYSNCTYILYFYLIIVKLLSSLLLCRCKQLFPSYKGSNFQIYYVAYQSKELEHRLSVFKANVFPQTIVFSLTVNRISTGMTELGVKKVFNSYKDLLYEWAL